MTTKTAKIDKTTGIEFVPPTDASPETPPSAPSETLPPTDDNAVPPSFETYRAKAREHGQSRAVGDDSFALLAIDIADGSKAKLIDPRTTTDKTKDNAADTSDDIETLLTDYVEARGLKAIHERKGNSVGNKVSQLRKFAHLGRLVDVDGPSVLSDVVARYKVTYAKASEDERKLMNDAFTAYYKAAMAQVDQPKTGLSDAQIGECIRKKISPNKRNVATEWNKIATAAKSLTDGTRKLADGSVIEDKSVDGGKLAALIVAYAKAMSDEVTLAEAEAKAAELRAQMIARNGAAPAEQENIPA